MRTQQHPLILQVKLWKKLTNLAQALSPKKLLIAMNREAETFLVMLIIATFLGLFVYYYSNHRDTTIEFHLPQVEVKP